MKIIRCKLEDREFRYFSEVLASVYSSDSIRNRQQENINTDFFHKALIIFQNEKPAGRLVIYNNPGLKYKEKKCACIGNYECINDPEISRILLTVSEEEVNSLQAEYIIGPMNGSTWDNYRFSAHNNHRNFLLEPYHPQYYNDHFTAMGYSQVSSYSSSIDYTVPSEIPEILKREKELCESGVTIRSIRTGELERELDLLYPFISDAFRNNFLYTSISRKTFIEKYLQAASIIDPGFVLIAEDIAQNIIGFIFSYQDLYNTKEKSLVVKTVARNQSAEWTGLGRVMGNKVVSLAKSREFKSVIHAFMIEEAVSSGLSSTFSGRIYKNYLLYGKPTDFEN
jgi:hypothetical protein